MLLEDRVSAESGQHPELTTQPQEERSQPLDEKSQLQYEKSQFRDDQSHASSLISEITRGKDEL
jgi:hypothetical protein